MIFELWWRLVGSAPPSELVEAGRPGAAASRPAG
jgi:hypothetical protein